MTSRSAHLHVSATSGPERAKLRMGYEIAPVRLDTRGKNRVLTGEPMIGRFSRSFWEAHTRALASLLMLAATAPSLADGTLEKLPDCGASSPQEARSLGDLLIKQTAYQRAAACYEAAGDYDLANGAYLKAVGPESKRTAHDLEQQRDQTKALIHNIQLSFRAHR